MDKGLSLRYLLLLVWPVLLYAYRTRFLFTSDALLPGAFINMLVGGYLIQGRWHYDHSTFAGVLIAVLISLERIKWKRTLACSLVFVTLGLHLKGTFLREPLIKLWHPSFWEIGKIPQVRFLEQLNREIPENLILFSRAGFS